MPVDGDAQQLAKWAQVATGTQLDGNDQLRQLSADEREAAVEHLASLGGTPRLAMLSPVIELSSRPTEPVRQTVHRLSLGSYIKRTQALFEEGDAYGAMLWILEAMRHLQLTPAYERAFRTTLSGCILSLQHQPQELLRFDAQIRLLEISPDGVLMLVGTNDAVELWNIEALSFLGELPHPKRVYSANFSPDGKLVATGCSDGFARLWNVDGRALVATVRHGGDRTGRITALDFDAKGQKLLTGGYDGAVRLWNVGANESKLKKQYEKPVNAVAFSPNGELIASSSGASEPFGGRNPTIEIWNLKTGDQVRAIRASGPPSQLVEWSCYRGAVTTVPRSCGTFPPEREGFR